jgi:PilZ domain-containing protein
VVADPGRENLLVPRPVSEHCIVIIAASDLLPALRQSIDAGGELLAFSDAEALKALEVISRRSPRLVLIERSFAATPRGAALINRIKADPTLTGSEIRVVSSAPEPGPVMSPITASDRSSAAVSLGTSVDPSAATVATMPRPALDQRGTRRFLRSRMIGNLEAVADGNAVTLVDLSMAGAQVVSTVILKPNQRLRMMLTDPQATIRVNGMVAWASFEIPPDSGPRYRAGVEFLDADSEAVEAFRLRHHG